MAGEWTAVRLPQSKRPSEGTVIARGDHPQDVEHLWEPGVVAICWTEAPSPVRRLSQDGLARVRRARLRRRLEKKCPLFADQLFDQELAARPDYFAGVR